MRNVFVGISSLAVAVSALALGGCGSDGGDGTLEPAAPEDFEPAGQIANPEIVYAPAPYGVSKGSIIANFQFVGFPNAMEDNGGFRLIQLADFYNPTGNEVFPEGSLYGAGTAKPKALLIDVASVWCGPCNDEADYVLPGKYLQYKPQGGEFLLMLADGKDPGEPATGESLRKWTTKYEVDFPAAFDPSYKLGNLFVADVFPQNMIINTRTMEIVEVIGGAPDGEFWKTYQDVLDEP